MADETFNQWRRTKQSNSEKQTQKQSWTPSNGDSTRVTHTIEISKKLKQVTETLDDWSFTRRLVTPDQPCARTDISNELPKQNETLPDGGPLSNGTTGGSVSSGSTYAGIFESSTDGSDVEDIPRPSDESVQQCELPPTSNSSVTPENDELLSNPDPNDTLHIIWTLPDSVQRPNFRRSISTQDVGVDTNDLTRSERDESTETDTRKINRQPTDEDLIQFLRLRLNYIGRPWNEVQKEHETCESPAVSVNSESAEYGESDVVVDALEEDIGESDQVSSQSLRSSETLSPNVSDISENDFGSEPISSSASDPLCLNTLFPSTESPGKVPDEMYEPTFPSEFSSEDVFASVSDNLQNSENSLSSANLDTLFGFQSNSKEKEHETDGSANDESSRNDAVIEQLSKKGRKVHFSLDALADDAPGSHLLGESFDDFGNVPFQDGTIKSSEESNECRLSSEGDMVIDSDQVMQRAGRKKPNDRVKLVRCGKRLKKKPWKAFRVCPDYNFY